MRPSRLLWCAALCLVPVTTVSAPAAADVPFSPVDLAARTVTVGSEYPDLAADRVLLLGSLPEEIPGCRLRISAGELSGECAYLWAMEAPGPVELELRSGQGTARIALTRGWTGGGRVTLDAATRELVLPVGFPGGAVTLLRYGDGPSGWVELDAAGDRLPLDAATFDAATRMNGRYTVFGQDGDRVLAYQALPAAAPHPVVAVPRHPAGPPGGGDTAGQPEAWVKTDGSDDRGRWRISVPPQLACPPAKLPYEDMIVVCVDATQDVLRYTMVPEGTRLTKPNRYFYIQVLHFVDRKVDINLGGQIGSWVPAARGNLRVSAGAGRGGGIGGAQGGAPDLTVSSQTLAPRQPGYAPLTVRMSNDAGEPIGSPLLVEFWVDETYSGAFRMGVAGVFLGGVERTYAKVTQPNSQQAEIQAGGANPVDIDLVVGYAAYLDSGGRSAVGCESAPFCFAPYFGLGVVSASGGGDLEFLKSVHLGVEWELTSTFSIGLTANLRRVERLAEGYRPGMPIAGEIPTEDRYLLGAGLVINLSPSFFKIGAGGAAALLQ
ncbi:MAG: hypothetical protein CSA66_00210 [Proteobacteria bacterium]|nr:MAG: hypothetical protein CSA66_00210 [Pseudomonadota bacterium]